MSSTNLQILNVGNIPTFINRVREEVIDMTLATPRMAREVKNWKVSEEVTFSDHRWITFEIDSDHEQPKKFRNPRRTDWTKYENILNESLNFSPVIPKSIPEINEMCKRVQMEIMNAYEASCPLRYPPPQSDGVPNWTAELSELKSKARSSFNDARNPEKPEATWEDHLAHKRAFKKATGMARRKNWIDFSNEVKPFKPMA